MELWSEIRRRVLAGEISLRQACAAYGLNFRTVRKIVRHAEPPPFRAPPPRRRPVLGPFLAVIQQILDDDRHAPPKQRHTARRIYERLRDEHGYAGCPSIVRDAVRAYKQSQAEVFLPLLHPPGEFPWRYRLLRPAAALGPAGLAVNADQEVQRRADQEVQRS